MITRELGRSGLKVAPLAFGGNVFGWTVDEPTSFSLLDAFVAAGFNLIDTANVYSQWVPGNRGGESETIIGEWLRRRPGMRRNVLIATKVGFDMNSARAGLSPAYILQEVNRSLERLHTDYIDLYQSHIDDAKTPLDVLLETYGKLIRAGKVRAIGASNYTAPRLLEALRTSASTGLPRYETFQPGYSLYDRSSFEGELEVACRKEGLGTITHSSLARGFLTGKYRSNADLSKSPRGAFLDKLPNTTNIFDARGQRILAALDAVSVQTGATPAQISLAWLLAHGITAPIASATTLEQLSELERGVTLELPDSALRLLDEASALQPATAA
jgi:aryl-alcohol dehydrogenase-like predicted oxidoreductase